MCLQCVQPLQCLGWLDCLACLQVSPMSRVSGMTWLSSLSPLSRVLTLSRVSVYYVFLECLGCLGCLQRCVKKNLRHLTSNHKPRESQPTNVKKKEHACSKAGLRILERGRQAPAHWQRPTGIKANFSETVPEMAPENATSPNAHNKREGSASPALPDHPFPRRLSAEPRDHPSEANAQRMSEQNTPKTSPT